MTSRRRIEEKEGSCNAGKEQWDLSEDEKVLKRHEDLSLPGTERTGSQRRRCGETKESPSFTPGSKLFKEGRIELALERYKKAICLPLELGLSGRGPFELH